MIRFIFLVAVFLFFHSSFSQTVSCFNPGVYSYTTGGNSPGNIASGDFNGDGKRDIVVTNAFVNNFSLLLGSGTGSFSLPTYFPFASPGFIIADDLNADGKLDIVITCSNVLHIKLGNGAGGFASSLYETMPTNDVCGNVVSGDVNNDGKKDLIVSGYWGIVVFIGDGTGNFANGVAYNTSWTPWDVIISDFNADGKPDLAASISQDGVVDILMGDGSGTFPTYVSAAAGTSIICCELNAGDFDGDGKMDILCANASGLGTGYKVPLLRGNGNGTFMGPIFSTFPAGYIAGLVRAHDFNKDGILDYAAMCMTSGPMSQLAIRTGIGNGTFNPPVYYTLGAEPVDIHIEDFTNDGLSDIAVDFDLNNGIPNVVRLYHNNYPSVQVSGSSTLCSGSSVTLTASGATSYTWDTGSNSNFIVVAPTTNTVYNVVVTATNGCSTSAAKSVTVIACSGLEELLENEELVSVFPNPASSVLNVKVNAELESASIGIYDVVGSEIHQLELTRSSSFQLNREKMSSGIYFYRVKSDGKFIQSGKLVIQ